MDSVVSRGVTTCAGMTAHTVIVAQTRVGFLTGGCKQCFRDLPQEEEQSVQLEAFARATVAITRARCTRDLLRLCISLLRKLVGEDSVFRFPSVSSL